ncbi:MAG: phosphatidylserine/phosphatidylglycerophosphate/cardiolipin synthase family protein [Patescibacteria group bacterium]
MSDGFTYQFYKTTSEAWDAMYQAIESAQKSIFWEVYIFVDDSIGNKFIDALARKARAGLEVKLIIDAMGSSEFSASAEGTCREAGVELLKFNPTSPLFGLRNWIGRLIRRNHRKVLIIDEEVVFLGGVNIKAAFKTWDDLYVKLTGNLARPLLRGFAKSYISSGGKRRNVRRFLYPRLENLIPLWREKLNFIVHSPNRVSIPRRRMVFLKALDMAKETFNLLTPYYVPDRKFLRAVELAKKRGVKVNIFLPRRTDVRLAELIARTYYDLTMKAGANIYFLPNMHHGKAMSVDNNLGMIGSINMTPRSFTNREESAVSFTDVRMVDELNALFNDLQSKSVPLDMARFHQRNWFDRAKEWLAKKLEYFV